MFAISSAPDGFLFIIYPAQHNSSVLYDKNSTENSIVMKGMCLAYQLRSKPTPGVNRTPVDNPRNLDFLVFSASLSHLPSAVHFSALPS